MNRELFQRKYIGAKIIDNGRRVVAILVTDHHDRCLDEGKEPAGFYLLSVDEDRGRLGNYGGDSFTSGWEKYPKEFE